MKVEATLTIGLQDKAHLTTDQFGSWLKIGDGMLDVPVFLPRSVSAEKAQTICDAINDALEAAREAQAEAA